MTMPKSAAAERRSKASAGAAVVLAAAALCWSCQAFATAAAPWHRATAVSQVASSRGALAVSPLFGASRGAASQALMARQAEASEASGVRIGVLTVKGAGADLKGALEKLNVNMTSGYFSTEVPDAFQLPISAKWLAMSQTVDAVIVAHGALTPVEKTEALKTYQSVSLNFNVPIVPCSAEDSSEQVAAVAVSMAEIRMQALMGAGPRQSSFFGIGKAASAEGASAAPGKKEKVRF